MGDMENFEHDFFIGTEWERIKHKFVSANGIKMHVAELGEGPIVLFLHGFPELWFSWRHQILFLAKNGFHTVAPDLRSYGGSATGVDLNDISNFSIHTLVGDVVALIDAITKEQEKVFVVTHDWGAIIGWYLCLFRPDKVKAMVTLSVPFIPRDPMMDLVETLRATRGDDYYMCRFKEPPSEIEAELYTEDMRIIMMRFFSTFTAGTLYLPKGKGFGDSTPVCPTWLSDKELDYFTWYFKKTLLTGPINFYRGLHKTWEQTEPWNGAKVEVPTKYIVGDNDICYDMPGMKDYINNGGFEKDVPSLQGKVIIPHVSHFIQQEIPDEINKQIYEFILPYV